MHNIPDDVSVRSSGCGEMEQVAHHASFYRISFVRQADGQAGSFGAAKFYPHHTYLHILLEPDADHAEH